MKKILVFLSVLLSVSCSSTRYLAENVPDAEIFEAGRFEAISRISLIEKGNRAAHNDSLSQEFGGRLDDIIALRAPFAMPPEKMVFADTAEMRSMAEDLTVLAGIAERAMASGSKKERAKPIYTTHLIDSLLEAHGVKRAILTLHTGFTRTGANMAGQVAKGMGLGVVTAVATMGMVSVYTVPVKANSTICIFVVDGERKQLVFYDKSFLQGEPGKEKTLVKQVDKIFQKP